MAVLAYARKDIDTETDISVQYHFGGDPENLSRVVVFDKTTKLPVIEDGIINPLATGACAAVIRKLNATGTWPDKAMHAA